MSGYKYVNPKSKKKKKKQNEESDSESSDYKPSKRRRSNFWHKDLLSDVYSRDNHIIFKGMVNKDNVYKLCEEINTLNTNYTNLQKAVDAVIMQPKPIYLHLNTYGGYLDDAFAAVDFIKTSKIPIHTIIEGRCASAGTLMSVVGSKRYMNKNSRMLIHQLSGGMWGKYEEIKDSMIEFKDAMDDICNIYVEHTNMTRTQIRAHLKKDIWWDLDVCIEKGLVDEEWIDDV